MSGNDDFDDFLARRKPLFPRPPDDVLEPPAELDRTVLRKAREAIRPESPEPAYHGTRWGMPVALAASVLVVATLLLNLAWKRGDEVAVQTVAQRTEQAQELTARAGGTPQPSPAAPAPPPPAPPPAGDMDTPAWRQDQRTWIAEIERLRAAGLTAEADAEMAEFRRQHRAYAASPDR